MIKVESEDPMIIATKPMGRLYEIPTPPFLTKTYEMVDDTTTDDVVSWSRSRNSFVVWDFTKLCTTLLPKYFKHGNFSSFIRQLNTYGFRKVDPDRWEFANEGFLRGRKDLLKSIKRRRHAALNQPHHGGASPCVEGVVERLERDCSVLTTEIVNLKQQYQESRECIVAVQNRLRTAERKQQRMMSFLAKALNNSAFIQQLMLDTAERKALDGGSRRKRRLIGSASTGAENLAVLDDLVGQGYDDFVNMGSEFDALFGSGFDSDSSNNVKVQRNETMARTGDSNVDSVNEKLWNELLAGNLVLDNDDDDEQLDIPHMEDLGGENPSDWGEEDLQELVEQMDYHETNP